MESDEPLEEAYARGKGVTAEKAQFLLRAFSAPFSGTVLSPKDSKELVRWAAVSQERPSDKG